MSQFLRLFTAVALVLSFGAVAQATSTISYVGGCTGTTSCTLPAHQANDLIIGYGYRSGSTTPPTVPAGWTTLHNATGANTNSDAVACKYAATNAETSGTWTNATAFIIEIYRGTQGGSTALCTASARMIGSNVASGSTGSSITYGAITLSDAGGTSWVVGCAGHVTASNVSIAPTGMTNRNSQGVGPMAACHDTNGTVTSWTSQAVTVSASSGWQSFVLEIRACKTSICLVNSSTLQATATATTIAAPVRNHAAGHLLVVGVGAGSDSITASSIANTAGDAFTQGTSCRVTGNSDFTDVWYAKNIAGNSSDAVTVTYSATVAFRNITVAEYSGADTSSPFEVCATGVVTGTTVTSGSFSPAAANNVNFTEARCPGGSAVWTVGANYELLEGQNANTGYQTEQRADAPSGSQTASITYSASITSLKISVASFKVASGGGSGGGATATPQLMMMGVGD